MTTTTPTDRQAEVYAAVVAYWRDHGQSPSVRDVCDALGFASTNAAAGHLKSLARKGLIELGDERTARGIWPAGMRAAIRRLAAKLA